MRGLAAKITHLYRAVRDVRCCPDLATIMSKARTENSLGNFGGGQGGKPEPTSGGKLPLETTSFVGRRRELSEVEGLLGRTRLLTPVEVGAPGKTRPVLRVVVRWVELASLSGPELVTLERP